MTPSNITDGDVSRLDHKMINLKSFEQLWILKKKKKETYFYESVVQFSFSHCQYIKDQSKNICRCKKLTLHV